MICKNTAKKPRLALLAVLLAAACLLGAFPAFAVGSGGENYIVKYKESAAWLRKDGSVPFDVVSKSRALFLDRAGLLEWYEPDGEMELQGGTVSAWYEDDKWDLAMIHADAAFEQGFLGQGVRIGVLDSGINPHPILMDCLVPGRNYTENGDPEDTADNYGHGTLVAGLIAGTGENGYLGAAPAAEIVPIKITDGQIVSISAICRGIYGAIDDFHCQILNLSLGTSSEYKTVREAVAYAEERGVLIVSAVGNDGADGLYYPAAYDTVIGVGAVDRDGCIYNLSNHNSSVYLTAPGAEVKTAGKRDGFVTATGTSYSVSFVTAAAAVLLGMDDTLTPAELRELLSSTATDAGAEGWDEYYGWGVLDLEQAVAAARETPTTPTNPQEEQEPASSAPIGSFRFDDVTDESAYYFTPVYWAYENTVTDGIEPNLFGPDDTATRAQMVTFVWRAFHRPEPAITETPFTDLDENEYYYKAVLWAYEQGLTDGTDPDKFSPDDKVTRCQAITFLYRSLVESLYGPLNEDNDRPATLPGASQDHAAGSPGAETPFTDLDENEYYYSAVVWAYESSFTADICEEDTAFRPDDPCLRRDIVTILYLAYNR